jgi:Uma2 family endonuclease
MTHPPATVHYGAMSTLTIPPSAPPIVYPDSDGLPMAENTLQFQWITTITCGLDDLFADDPNVFVAGDLFWYPVQRRPRVRLAPDTIVAFGRPKGHRGSYRQWEEGGIAPQVVFEILSPGNRFGEMSAKFDFYRQYGVEEYYLYDPDPDRLELSGFLRRRKKLVKIKTMHGHVSPRLKVKFEMGEEGLRMIRPDGQPFVTFRELSLQKEQERRRADEQKRLADEQKRLADEQKRLADEQRQLAERERDRADRLQVELERLRREAGRTDPAGS